MLTMGPIVAGSFYPAEAGSLKAEVHRLLGEADSSPIDDLRAVIVPHAGYRYSGPIAASAYALVEGESFERVVLIGPSHFVWFSGLATPAVDAWTTPVGHFPVEAAPDIPGVREPFANEHCLEVQLPFLHEVLGPLPITPILTGDISPRRAAEHLDRVVDDDTLLVVSTDLSHYLAYERARRLDAETAEAVVAVEPNRLGPDSACGRTGLQAALLLAQMRNWEVRLLDLRNSGDTAGDLLRVVGYGAFAMGR